MFSDSIIRNLTIPAEKGGVQREHLVEYLMLHRRVLTYGEAFSSRYPKPKPGKRYFGCLE